MLMYLLTYIFIHRKNDTGRLFLGHNTWILSCTDLFCNDLQSW